MSVREQNKGRKGLTLGQDGNALIMLITVNAVMFVLFKFIEIIYSVTGLEMAKYGQNVLNWFVVPPGAEKLVTRPWSVLTSMFIEVRPLSLIASMAWLGAFGYILQDLTGNRKLGPLYIYGGLAGAIFFLLSVNLFPALHNQIATIGALWGPGPAIMAIAVATTALSPDYRIFPLINGGIPLWVLTLVYVLINFATINAGGPERAALSIAHLAAAGMGLLYVRRLRAGKDLGEWMHQFYNWIFTVFEPKKQTKLPAQKIKSEVFYDTKGQQPFRKTPNITQQKIDEILDKIGKEGYHFLTDDEKDYLKRASKDL